MKRTGISISAEDAHQAMLEGLSMWFKGHDFPPGSLRELEQMIVFQSFAEDAATKHPLERTTTENYLVGLLISIAEMNMTAAQMGLVS